MAKLGRVLTVVEAVCALLMPVVSYATTVDVFLISQQSSPAGASTAPFPVNATSVYELNLDTTGLATGFSTAPDLTFDVFTALTYAGHSGWINPWEWGGRRAERVNREVGIWDDVGIVNEGRDDARLNTDYTGFLSGAEVVFNPLSGGSPGVIVAEDAGLDPFQLSLCSDANCSDRDVVFRGFDDHTLSLLLALPDFSAGDSNDPSKMDQAFVFQFRSPVTDFVAVKYNGNPGGEALEVDFIGAGTVAPVTLPAPVPVPETAPLIVSAIGLMGLVGWRRRNKPTTKIWFPSRVRGEIS